MMQALEYLAAGAVLLIFALMTYGGYLMFLDEEHRYRERRNGKKPNERDKR
jgi:hypothetical protein